MVKFLRALGKFAILLIVPALVGVISFLWVERNFMAPADPSSRKLELFEIAPGAGFKTICHQLEERGFIRHWWSIDVIARMRGTDTQVQAGEYEVAPSMSPKEILQKLISGEVYKRKLLLKEGESIWALAPLVAQAGLGTAVEFDQVLSNPDVVKQAGITAPSFEGYLFPNTYFFSRPITPKDIIWGMLQEGEKRWKPEVNERAAQLGMTRHELLTLASIIEKESGNQREQPLISSVFHNRLRNGMKLESDPTVAYGIPDLNGQLLRKHLETEHPYNTYINFGLPPGPICNPGETAIQAALYPTPDSQYLFFVADGQGGHVFSTTLAEHNKAVAQYRALMKEAVAAPSPTPKP
jgi:UPF0755 protein